MRVFRNINIKETGAFQYLQVPMELITDPYYGNRSPFGRPLSGEAKILYSLMLNRTGLSREKNWVTENGDVYIIYTIKQIEEVMSCANQKAGKMLKELLEYGLIEKKRRGQGKPDIIFVKAFYDSKNGEDGNNGVGKILEDTGEIQKCENHISRSVKTTYLEMWKSHAIYKDIYNLNLDSCYCEGGDSDVEQKKQKIKEQIGYDMLLDNFPKEEVDSVIESIAFINNTEEKSIRIRDGTLKPEEIREAFKDLSYEVVKQILENALMTSGYKHRNYYIFALFNQVKARRNHRPKKSTFQNFEGRHYTKEDWIEIEKRMLAT